MSAIDSMQLLVRVDGVSTELLSPGVGNFMAALPLGAIVSPGQFAGELATLGKISQLVVPADVQGVVRSHPPKRTRAAVGYGQVLYELSALEAASAAVQQRTSASSEAGTDLGLRSPQSGRFYHRSAPGDASLCEVGRELEIGTPIGLIEVMKTFTQVVYRAERGLPPRARIVRVMVRDGADVDEGAVLIVVEIR